MMWRYGMRLRPFAPMCQPTLGLQYCENHGSAFKWINGQRYWDILVYDRKLSKEELHDYDLDDLGEIEEGGKEHGTGRRV